MNGTDAEPENGAMVTMSSSEYEYLLEEETARANSLIGALRVGNPRYCDPDFGLYLEYKDARRKRMEAGEQDE